MRKIEDIKDFVKHSFYEVLWVFLRNSTTIIKLLKYKKVFYSQII